MFKADEKNNQDKGMTRRKFVISLGAGVTSIIAGYFLVSKSFSPPRRLEEKNDRSVRPLLRKEVIFGSKDGLMTIVLPHGEEPVLCAVNPLGAEIIKRLDGNHTIEDIRNALALKLKKGNPGEMDAKIAYFVAQTAMWGFLSEPFYACLFETYDA